MQQQEIVAGDSLNFPVSGGAYPASAGWVLTYLLVPRVAGANITFGTTANGDDFAVALAASVTAAWTAGQYTWFQRVERAGEKYTVDDGQLTIKPNPESLTGAYDGRSLARKTLDDLRTAFATFSATRGTQRRYKIGEREMEFNSAAEIIKLLTWWEQQVATEDRHAGRAEPISRRVYSRI